MTIPDALWRKAADAIRSGGEVLGALWWLQRHRREECRTARIPGRDNAKLLEVRETRLTPVIALGKDAVVELPDFVDVLACICRGVVAGFSTRASTPWTAERAQQLDEGAVGVVPKLRVNTRGCSDVILSR